MTRALSGLLGAIVGAFTGMVLTVWLVLRTTNDGDPLGFEAMGSAPIGLIVGLITGIICGLKSFNFLHLADPNGALQAKKHRLGTVLILGPIFIIGLSLHGCAHVDDPPPDAVMLTHFAAHRAQFEELAQMVQHDKGLWRVDQNWTGPDKPQTVGVSPARIAEYRQKLRAAGVPRGFQGEDKNVIDFLYFLRGSAISSDTDKDFTYLAKAPPSVLLSLDNCSPTGRDVYRAYRHIDGPWYLCYSYIPD